MSDLYVETRLQAIKDIASASCVDIKDADNIASFCDEIYSAIPKIDKIVEELELHSFEFGADTLPAHYVRLNDAIEIVKQGGISNDVCEWRLCDEESNMQFDRPLPTKGEKYKHFKLGKIVTVIGLSRHTETEEITVVYEYEGTIWNRSLEMFMSEVDKEKYPNVSQKYRFEKVVE